MGNGKHVHKWTGCVVRLPVVISPSYVVAPVYEHRAFQEIVFSLEAQFEQTAAKRAIYPGEIGVSSRRVIYSLSSNPVGENVRRVKEFFRNVMS